VNVRRAAVTKIWDRGVARGELVLIADLGDHP
jgi:hypothetical protein